MTHGTDRKQSKDMINRRDFLKKTGGVALGTATALGAGFSSLAAESGSLTVNGLPAATLGRTGLKVTKISFGGMLISEPPVLPQERMRRSKRIMRHWRFSSATRTTRRPRGYDITPTRLTLTAWSAFWTASEAPTKSFPPSTSLAPRAKGQPAPCSPRCSAQTGTRLDCTPRHMCWIYVSASASTEL